MERFLGIDAGGSKLRWACISADDAVLGEGEGMGVHPAVQGVDAAGAALGAVLCDLHQEFAPALTVAGLAGVGAASTRAQLAERLTEAGVQGDVLLCGDPEVAAATALADGPGVAVWAGTGSFAIARRAGGQIERIGGRGYLLGDRGSGFAIVRGAAVAAVEAVDGLGPHTVVADMLRESFGVARIEDLGGHLQQLPTREVAARVHVVFAAADGGDPVAERVVATEVECLAACVREIARRAEVPTSPCAAGGGVLRNFPSYSARLCMALGGEVRPLRDSEAVGAARLARAAHRAEQPLAGWIQ